MITIDRSQVPSYLPTVPAFSIVIDPARTDYKQLVPICDPMSPSKCLVNTFMKGALRSVTPDLDCSFHIWYAEDGRPVGGEMRIFLGKGYRVVREAPEDLLMTAEKFDKRKKIRAVTFYVDVADGSWEYQYWPPERPESSTRRPERNGDREKQSRRAASLQAAMRSVAGYRANEPAGSLFSSIKL